MVFRSSLDLVRIHRYSYKHEIHSHLVCSTIYKIYSTLLTLFLAIRMWIYEVMKWYEKGYRMKDDQIKRKNVDGIARLVLSQGMNEKLFVDCEAFDVRSAVIR